MRKTLKSANGADSEKNSLMAMLEGQKKDFLRDRSPQKQAQFAAFWLQIRDALDSGWNPKAIWRALKENGKIEFNYSSMLRFIELKKYDEARIIPLEKLGAVGQLTDHPGWFATGEDYLKCLARYKLSEFALAVKEVLLMRPELFRNPNTDENAEFSNQIMVNENVRGLISTRNYFAERPQFFINDKVFKTFIAGQKNLFDKLDAINRGEKETLDLVHVIRDFFKEKPDFTKLAPEKRVSLIKFLPSLSEITPL